MNEPVLCATLISRTTSKCDPHCPPDLRSHYSAIETRENCYSFDDNQLVLALTQISSCATAKLPIEQAM